MTQPSFEYLEDKKVLRQVPEMMRVLGDISIWKDYPTCPKAIPMGILSEGQAMHNHGQTLSRLNNRGGLSLCEIVAIIENRGWAPLLNTSLYIKHINDTAASFLASLPTYPVITPTEQWEREVRGRKDLKEGVDFTLEDGEWGKEYYSNGDYTGTKTCKIVAIPILPVQEEVKGGDEGESAEPIHEWFSLSYAQYLTIPRSVLQSMPTEWQERFVQCLNELDETIAWRPKSGRYWVRLKDNQGRYISDPLMDYERGRRVVPHARTPTNKSNI